MEGKKIRKETPQQRGRKGAKPREKQDERK
jgi:hypothetical protein